jgi:hypothetical protein
MKTIIPIILGVIALCIASFSIGLTLGSKPIEIDTQKATEFGYFEGQVDFMQGDIRIRQQNGRFVWVKSPWEDNRDPIYSNK